MTVQTAPVAGPEIGVRGPANAHSDGESVRRSGARHRRESAAPAFSCVNAHGGAGATTLANILDAADLGCRWPVTARGDSGRVLLVARTHAAGLQAAGRILDSVEKHRRPDVRVLALVLVADAPGRVPRQLAQRIRLLRSAFKTFDIPWIPAWRVGEQPENLPKEVMNLAQFLQNPLGTR